MYLVFEGLLEYAMNPDHDQAEVRGGREGDEGSGWVLR
jgi:hypothetical protein